MYRVIDVKLSAVVKGKLILAVLLTSVECKGNSDDYALAHWRVANGSRRAGILTDLAEGQQQSGVF